jgi:hypothetical protein
MVSATRKNRKGIFGRVYSPLHHLLSATRNVSNSLLNRSKRVLGEGIGIVDNTGRALTRHANMAVSDLTSGMMKKKRRSTAKKTRKNRRNRRN